MWVRSQNKLKLVKVDSFEIINNSLEMAAVDSEDQSKWIINDLAEYTSLEKAMIVLNLIEMQLKSGRDFYEFPKDEDV